MTDFINLLHGNIIIVLLAMSFFSFLFTAAAGAKVKSAKIKRIALTLSFVIFIASLCLYTGFERSNPSLQFNKSFTWIESLNINFSVGVDGLSLFMILLATLLTLIVIAAADEKIANFNYYISLYFLLEFTMIGTFCAADIILFYLLSVNFIIIMIFLNILF